MYVSRFLNVALGASVILILVFASIVTGVGAQARVGAPYTPPASVYGAPTPPPSAAFTSIPEPWGPYIEILQYAWFGPSGNPLGALFSGEVQYDAAGLNPGDYLYLASHPSGFAVNLTPADTFYFIGFNMRSAPFDNVFFRRGIQRLINYNALDGVLGGGASGFPSPYFLYPGIFPGYFSPNQSEAYSEVGSYNLSAAIVDFEHAGLKYSGGEWTYPNGTLALFTIYVGTTASEQMEEEVLSVISQDALAINLTIEVQPVSNLYSLIESGSFGMFMASYTTGAPLNVYWLYTLFNQNGVAEAIEGYSNITVERLAEKIGAASTQQELYTYTERLAVDLQQDLPFVVVAWASAADPVNIMQWRGYILEPPFGVSLLDVNPAPGNQGGIFTVGIGGEPDTLNPYSATLAYSWAILSNIYASPLQVSPDSPSQLAPFLAYNYTFRLSAGYTPGGHPYNGSVATFSFLPNAVWQDGVPLTALDYNFTLWYLDVAGYKSNPYGGQAVTIDPGVSVNYAVEPYSRFYGSVPGLVYSYVSPSDPYEITLYFNTTSLYSFTAASLIPVLPEHIFAGIQPARLAAMTLRGYFPLLVGSSAYMVLEYTNQSVYLGRFPAYFLSNPYSDIVTAAPGSNATWVVQAYTWNSTVYVSSEGVVETGQPVNGATATAYLLSGGRVLMEEPMRWSGGGNYTAEIPTLGLPQGNYTLVAQVNWTGNTYPYFFGGSTTSNKYFLQYVAELNVVGNNQTTGPQTTQPHTASTPTGTHMLVEYSILGFLAAVICAVAIYVWKSRGVDQLAEV